MTIVTFNRSLLLASAILAPATSALAAPHFGGTSWYVSPAGWDSGPGTQFQPFRTIQRAVNAASSGDKISLQAGTHRPEQTIELFNKSLHITGDVRFYDDQPLTIISGDTDGDGVGDIRLFECEGIQAESWGFNALELRDGLAEGNVGGGLARVIDSNPNFGRCHFVNNQALDGEEYVMDLAGNVSARAVPTPGGGALSIETGSEVRISTSWFTGNYSAGNGGAVAVDADSTLIAIDTRFEMNASGGDGGAIHTDGEFYAWVDPIFHANSATGRGGAIHATAAASVINLTDTLLEGNVADSGAGAIHADCNIGILDCEVRHNFTGSRDSVSAIDCAGYAMVRGSLFIENGWDVTEVDFATHFGSARIENSTFENNHGVAVTASDYLSIEGCSFIGNTVGIELRDATGESTIESSVFGGDADSMTGAILIDTEVMLVDCGFGDLPVGLEAHGERVVIDDSRFLTNTTGLHLDGGAMLMRSTVEMNTRSGVVSNESCTISDCILQGNGTWGLYSNGFSLVDGCTIRLNSFSGVKIGWTLANSSGELRLSNSTICSNGADQVYDEQSKTGWNSLADASAWDLGGNTVSHRCSNADSDGAGGGSSEDEGGAGGGSGQDEGGAGGGSGQDEGGAGGGLPSRPDRGGRPARNR